MINNVKRDCVQSGNKKYTNHTKLYWYSIFNYICVVHCNYIHDMWVSTWFGIQQMA